MKAVSYDRYGSPEVLHVREVPTPIPKDNEVLVMVRAASINSWDWDMIRGEPWIVRAWGLRGPRYKIPGADISGIVTEVGKGVTKFKPGDEVFGDLCECGWGAYAEFACAKQDALALKSTTMSFEQAAAIPQAGLMALQGIDKSQIRKAEKLLMNGAGGGVGTFVIQIAKSMGVEITAVDVGTKLDALRRLGADHVIDYRNSDFTKEKIKYDTIIDVVASHSPFSYKRALSKTGRLIIIGGHTSVLIGTLIVGGALSHKGGQKLGMLAYRANKGLDRMTELFDTGTITPIIDSVFSLNQAPEAFRHFAKGSFLGKVVITIST